MTQSSNDSNVGDPMAAWRTMRDATMETWSKTMVDMVNTDAFAQSLGAYLDNYLSVSAPLRQSIETAMTYVLAQLNMPSRTDVTNLAERLTNIEVRLDDLDAKLDGFQGQSKPARTSASKPLKPEER
ncbi:MAG: hypothetical protein ACR2JC_06815 [Chloroflexota bacterium]|nr:MAG: hypothetical protein DLM70_10270 [Chloroflexota bacterium]